MFPLGGRRSLDSRLEHGSRELSSKVVNPEASYDDPRHDETHIRQTRPYQTSSFRQVMTDGARTGDAVRADGRAQAGAHTLNLSRDCLAKTMDLI